MTWFNILCMGATYCLLLLLAFAAPAVIILFVRLSTKMRIVMAMSATIFVSMGLYGVVLLANITRDSISTYTHRQRDAHLRH